MNNLSWFRNCERYHTAVNYFEQFFITPVVSDDTVNVLTAQPNELHFCTPETTFSCNGEWRVYGAYRSSWARPRYKLLHPLSELNCTPQSIDLNLKNGIFTGERTIRLRTCVSADDVSFTFSLKKTRG